MICVMVVGPSLSEHWILHDIMACMMLIGSEAYYYIYIILCVYNVIAWSDTGRTIPIPFLSIMNDLVISINLLTIEYAYYGQ